MPSKHFRDAINALEKDEQSKIRRQLDAWKAQATPSQWAQIAANIENETALPVPKFTALLRDFTTALTHHSTPENAWTQTCISHLFSGQPLVPSVRPKRLGRACKSDIFVKYANTTDKRFKDTLTKYAGKNPPSFWRNVLAKQNLGGDVIFATFNQNNTADDPFAGLPQDRESIRTALGLGHTSHSSPDPYLLFTYTSDEPPNLPIHRPTIADAGDFCHFRPAKSSAAKWGFTGPLAPNPQNLPPCPEVVHKQIVGVRLVFPYNLSTP